MPRSQLIFSLRNRLYKYRFLLIWVAFMIDFLIPSSSHLNTDNGIKVISFLSKLFFFLASLNLLQRGKNWFFFALFLSVIVLLLYYPANTYDHWVQMIYDVSLILFFIILTYKIFDDLVHAKGLSLNTLGAALSGYFTLGLIAGSALSIIEGQTPHSFQGIDYSRDIIGQLNYFSFITITSVGYGDISPVSELAQRASTIFAILGDIYSTIILGIIINQSIVRK